MSSRQWGLHGLGLLVGVMWSAALSAAPWNEVGDAGALPPSAQTTVGTGSLDSIDGSISGVNDADVYTIYVTGGGTFSASTHASDGGSAAFDTQLFLFNQSQIGVYANDDVDTTWRSRLPASHGLTPTTAGIYYLVITSWENDPVSAGGQIFLNPDLDYTVHAPDGPGAAGTISGYDNEGDESGSYHIVLTGAQFALAPPVAAPEATPIPTLTEWGVMGTTALVLLAAMFQLGGRIRKQD